jgi:GT2 family glycosyltransferase
MKKKVICAVSLNYKTYDKLEECIACLTKSLLPDGYILKIFIVDSEFDEQKLDSIAKKYPQVIFIKEKKNLGVGGGFNNGFRQALLFHPTYILMLTPDIFVEKDTIKKLVNKALQDQNIGMITPKMLLPTKPPKIYFVHGELDKKVKTSNHIGYGDSKINAYDSYENTDFVNCAIVLIKSEIFQKVGFMDPSYFLYYEDIDWSLRVKRAGYTITVLKDAVAWHDESSSVGKGSLKQEYYITRNHLKFVYKNFSFPEAFLASLYIGKECIGFCIDLIKNPHKGRSYFKLLGIKDFFFRNFGYKNLTAV